ncbi:hypothetical protein NM208_g15565 [Fusarium decemcellulare]|uniref:Uncharacterized protein n=1 Tax=Fusarium decemcellulare TaxID=57161 RepID=A0ACC1RDV9_9HYPO|nr:hypothetical protein NM208_g15565 [Fusarium decemcellulare]
MTLSGLKGACKRREARFHWQKLLAQLDDDGEDHGDHDDEAVLSGSSVERKVLLTSGAGPQVVSEGGAALEDPRYACVLYELYFLLLYLPACMEGLTASREEIESNILPIVLIPRSLYPISLSASIAAQTSGGCGHPRRLYESVESRDSGVSAGRLTVAISLLGSLSCPDLNHQSRPIRLHRLTTKASLTSQRKPIVSFLGPVASYSHQVRPSHRCPLHGKLHGTKLGRPGRAGCSPGLLRLNLGTPAGSHHRRCL